MFAPMVTPLHQMPTAHPTMSEEDTMRSKLTKAMLVGAAVAAAAVPSAALAKNGADDGAAHKRHARHPHVMAHDARHGADDAPGDARRGGGADDGPNHR